MVPSRRHAERGVTLGIDSEILLEAGITGGGPQEPNHRARPGGEGGNCPFKLGEFGADDDLHLSCGGADLHLRPRDFLLSQGHRLHIARATIYPHPPAARKRRVESEGSIAFYLRLW